jgi:hypothetical protein
VLAVAARSLLAFGDHDHRFHGDDHPRFEDRFAVLAVEAASPALRSCPKRRRGRAA